MIVLTVSSIPVSAIPWSLSSTPLTESGSTTRQWWSIFVWSIALTAAAGTLMGPLWADQTLLAAVTLVLSGTLITTGVILCTEAEHRKTAVLLVFAGLFWSGGWVEEWGNGPLPLTAQLASPIAFVLASWAIFRFPDPERLNRRDRIFLHLVGAWVVGTQAAHDLTSRPEWLNVPPSRTWWLTLHADRGLRDHIDSVAILGDGVLACVFLVLWLRRFGQVRGLDRRLMTPVAVSAVTAAIVSAAVPLFQLTNPSEHVLDRVYTVETTLIACVPLSFLVAVIRRQLAKTAVLTLVREVQLRPTPEAVQQSLQVALDDPTLRVSYWAPELSSYVDVAGLHVEPLPGASGRLVLPIDSGTGLPLAVIDANPDLRRHAEVVTGAVAAGGLALENAQLQAAVRAQLAQVRAARLRTVEAGVAERRRLERDLHDGAQQRLLALRLALATADDGSLHSTAKVFLHALSAQISLALEELRELARGIHPAVLSQAGLSAAVEAVVERQDLEIEPRLPMIRFPAATEETAYFIICAALGQAARHAATRVRIRGHESDGVLTIEVEDDGQAVGARMETGLGGLIDRVRALGGDIMLSSPPRGEGTLLVAAIPCG